MQTLYKMGKKGETRVWKIWNEDDIIFIEHGVLDGAMIEENIYIEEGKAGRTLEEQVELKMNSRINGKKNSGYVENIKDITSAPKNQMGFHRPMLASKVNYEKINYENAYIQRKYDGHRCLITRQGDQLIAYSRGGKPITSISHILAEVSLSEGETLDGELYIHGMPLQEISSKVRKQNVTAMDLKYIVYDMISNKKFEHRHTDLRNMFFQNNKSILVARTIRVMDENKINIFFMQFRNEGYEGAIVRHGNADYEIGRRSKYLMKVKGFEDEEFEVVDIISSVEGWARLICITNKGKKFKVSAPGTHAEKRKILKNKEKYIGKYVRVEFANWTIDKKPSQPIATMFRNKAEE